MMKLTFPEILDEIKNNEKLRLFFADIGFMLDQEIRYYCTPIDAFSFARTGSNGGHFCFLTDFGLSNNLAAAPIVFVNPSEFGTEQIQLVADNIYEFLGLLCYVKTSDFFIERFENEKEVEVFIKEQLSYLNEDGIDVVMMDILLSDFLNQFESKMIETPIEYMVRVNEMRKRKIQYTTEDGLGIINQIDDQEIKHFDFDKNELTDINTYLSQSSKIEQYIFYREFSNKFRGNRNWDNHFNIEKYLFDKYWENND